MYRRDIYPKIKILAARYSKPLEPSRLFLVFASLLEIQIEVVVEVGMKARRLAWVDMGWAAQVKKAKPGYEYWNALWRVGGMWRWWR